MDGLESHQTNSQRGISVGKVIGLMLCGLVVAGAGLAAWWHFEVFQPKISLSDYPEDTVAVFRINGVEALFSKVEALANQSPQLRALLAAIEQSGGETLQEVRRYCKLAKGGDCRFSVALEINPETGSPNVSFVALEGKENAKLIQLLTEGLGWQTLNDPSLPGVMVINIGLANLFLIEKDRFLAIVFDRQNAERLNKNHPKTGLATESIASQYFHDQTIALYINHSPIRARLETARDLDWLAGLIDESGVAGSFGIEKDVLKICAGQVADSVRQTLWRAFDDARDSVVSVNAMPTGIMIGLNHWFADKSPTKQWIDSLPGLSGKRRFRGLAANHLFYSEAVQIPPEFVIKASLSQACQEVSGGLVGQAMAGKIARWIETSASITTQRASFSLLANRGGIEGIAIGESDNPQAVTDAFLNMAQEAAQHPRVQAVMRLAPLAAEDVIRGDVHLKAFQLKFSGMDRGAVSGPGAVARLYLGDRDGLLFWIGHDSKHVYTVVAGEKGRVESLIDGAEKGESAQASEGFVAMQELLLAGGIRPYGLSLYDMLGLHSLLTVEPIEGQLANKDPGSPKPNYVGLVVGTTDHDGAAVRLWVPDHFLSEVGSIVGMTMRLKSGLAE